MSSYIIRPKSITLGKDENNTTTYYGIKRVRWNDVSPWVHIDIPHGAMLHQHLRSPHVEGEIAIHDLETLHNMLHNTTIDNSNHTLIEESTRKKYPAKYVKFTLIDHNGVEVEYEVDDFKVETVGVEAVELGTESLWIVRWTADNVVLV